MEFKKLREYTNPAILSSIISFIVVYMCGGPHFVLTLHSMIATINSPSNCDVHEGIRLLLHSSRHLVILNPFFHMRQICSYILFKRLKVLLQLLLFLGPLLFNAFINDICDAVAHCKYLLFADHIKIYRAVESPQDCTLLQSDINSIQCWCNANCMKLNITNTRVISFSRKTNVLKYD
jgi:hypothetical protein